jgi:hypothetical protein
MAHLWRRLSVAVGCGETHCAAVKQLVHPVKHALGLEIRRMRGPHSYRRL